jgi:tetratricopeptide (TPR) repeat protein
MRVLLPLALLGLVITTAGPTRALAEPASPSDPAVVKLARLYVDAGLAAQQAQDYDTAITLYSKAYQVMPHPLLIFNLAQAHRLAGHPEKALALYQRYLAEDPRGAQAQLARGFVTELLARQVEKQLAAERAAEHPRKDDGGADAAGPPADEPKTDPPAAPSGGTSVWKWALGGNLAVAVGAGAFMFAATRFASDNAAHTDAAVSDADCGKSAASLGLTPQGAQAFDRACTWHTRATVGMWVSGIALVGSVVSLVMVTRDSGAAEPAATASRRKPRAIAIAPVIAPGGGGGSLSLTW